MRENTLPVDSLNREATLSSLQTQLLPREIGFASDLLKLAYKDRSGTVHTFGEGSPGLVWRGPYSSVSTYEEKDVVQVNGSSYVANQHVPTAEPPPSSKWELLAAKGDPGSSEAPRWSAYTEGDVNWAYVYPPLTEHSFNNCLESDPTKVLNGSRSIPVAELRVGDILRLEWDGRVESITGYEAQFQLWRTGSDTFGSALSPETFVGTSQYTAMYRAKIVILSIDSTTLTMNLVHEVSMFDNESPYKEMARTREFWAGESHPIAEPLVLGFGINSNTLGRQYFCTIRRS